jgi:tRNA pseudouridine13 synthase
MSISILPYFTNGVPGVGGLIKQRPEDFRVDEFAPDETRGGRGRFVWFRLSKRGLTTSAAIAKVAAYMGVKASAIAFAGLKDANSISSQWVSLADADVRRLERLRDKDVRVSDIHYRPVSQEVGNLAGNRFVVRIRQIDRHQLDQVKSMLDLLRRRGVPNYFGVQRFGARGDNAALGEALIRGKHEEFLDIFLGRPWPGDPPRSQAAREAYDHGAVKRALSCWPSHCVDPRNALNAILAGKKPLEVIETINSRIRQIYLQSYQSLVFNDIVARRIDGIDGIEPGDIIEDHATGISSPLEDIAAAAARAEKFEISPTGLLPGRRMRIAAGRPGQIEREVLAEHDIDPQLFAPRPGAAGVEGARRALRFCPGDTKVTASSDLYGPFIEVSFTAPPGCYATVLLEEICKNRQPYVRSLTDACHS